MFRTIEQWILNNPLKLKVILGVGVFLLLANLTTLNRWTNPPIIKDEVMFVDLKPIEPLPAPKFKKIDKLAKIVPKAKTSHVVGLDKAPAGWFSDSSQCTFFVWSRRPVGKWNNASDWLWQAKRDGWATGLTPRAGAIAWQPGHVALVESVRGSMMTISERNYDFAGSTRTITVPVSSYSAFIY